ncbi:amidase [Patulibacter minatonensis]|uniref:amidase n=1 Tax=Patulibacter minatonensis TaxID=298163 RepID=UPI000479964F|nr:amidase [Patulibacter minatonensis]
MALTDISRRRFLGAAALSGAAVAVPALRSDAALADPPALHDVPTPARRFLEAQRQAGLAAVEGGSPLSHLTGTQLAAMLAARDVTSVAVTRSFLDQIEAKNGDGAFSVPSREPTIPVYGDNGQINAFARVTKDLALSMAADADTALDAAAKGGDPVPFGCGVPVALKDIYAVEGVELTIGCPLAAGNVATGDSTVAARFRAAHMPILGLTHTGPWTNDDTCPQTANPWKRDRCVGGSSGGSAAAISARMTALATGSDTGNSLRNPAQNVGVGSIKPTYGLVPKYGVTVSNTSLDTCGPMGRSMADVAMLLGIMAGPDPQDARSEQAPEFPLGFPLAPRPGDTPLSGIRIGSTIDTETSPARANWAPGILAQLKAAEQQFADLGAEIVKITPVASNLGNTTYFQAKAKDPNNGTTAISASNVYNYAENAFTLRDTYATTVAQSAPIEGAVRTRFRTSIATLEAQKKLLQDRAAVLTPEDLFGAQRVRREYSEAWAKVFADNRIVACLWPQKVQTPPLRANDQTGSFSGVESSRPNTTGWPCANIPIGRDANTGIPVGVDLAAPFGADAVVLQLAIDYQEHHPFHLDLPTEL